MEVVFCQRNKTFSNELLTYKFGKFFREIESVNEVYQSGRQCPDHKSPRILVHMKPN